MQELSWDDLKVVLACSRHGSTRSAAAALGVSNSTIARRLEAAFLIEHRMVYWQQRSVKSYYLSQKPLRIRYLTASYA